MTASQFAAECQIRFIDPAWALENDDIRRALAARDDLAVIAALDSEF